MTLGGLRAFYSAKLTALNLREWTDGFSRANIPSNILDNSFHIEIGQISSGPANNLIHEFKAPVIIRVFFKGYRNPAEAMDNALATGNSILNALLKSSVRFGGTDNLKDIRPVSVNPIPLSDSNDNSLILELAFETILKYHFS